MDGGQSIKVRPSPPASFPRMLEFDRVALAAIKLSWSPLLAGMRVSPTFNVKIGSYGGALTLVLDRKSVV